MVYDITRSNQGAKEAIADFKKSFPGIGGGADYIRVSLPLRGAGET